MGAMDLGYPWLKGLWRAGASGHAGSQRLSLVYVCLLPMDLRKRTRHPEGGSAALVLGLALLLLNRAIPLLLFPLNLWKFLSGDLSWLAGQGRWDARKCGIQGVVLGCVRRRCKDWVGQKLVVLVFTVG